MPGGDQRCAGHSLPRYSEDGRHEVAQDEAGLVLRRLGAPLFGDFSCIFLGGKQFRLEYKNFYSLDLAKDGTGQVYNTKSRGRSPFKLSGS